MKNHRNPYLDSALSVVKGAVCFITGLPIGRSTKSVKFINSNEATLTVGAFSSPFSSLQIDEIKNCTDQKILEDARFHVLVVPREYAESFYGEMFLDDFGISSTLTEIRLVLLEGWCLNCNIFPVIKSTGLLNKIEFKHFKFKQRKSVVEITFTVAVNVPPVMDPSLLALAVQISCLEELLDFPMVDSPFSNKDSVIPSSNEKEAVSQIVTPWTVEAEQNEGIDYDRLVFQFGCSKLTQTLMDRIESLTNRKAHYLLRRGFFFSHRDLNKLLDAYENNHPFYLYTGRGPSSESLHLGHLIPFMFTKYLQEAFNVPVVIHLSDDEKFIFKDELSLQQVRHQAIENIKDIIAIGFDLNKTLILMSSKSMDLLYETALEIQKKVTYNQMRGIFGFQNSDNIGKLLYPTIQAALSFSTSLPNLFGENRRDVWCLIPQAIDQDPYFRMARDVAPRLGLLKPALVHSRFIPALQGLKTKMSGSVQSSSIYCTDTPDEIKFKINKYAFTGGRATVQEHREKGANLDVDVPIQYLTCFMSDDERLDTIKKDYAAGKLLSGEVKSILIEVLTELISEHQKRRNQVTNEMIEDFMRRERKSFQVFKKPT